MAQPGDRSAGEGSGHTLNAFMERAVGDMGAAMHAALIVIGDKLGLYKAMAGGGWMIWGELAETTKTTERYVREWLNANAASGYVQYDAATKRYELPVEQAYALTSLNLPGAFHVISSCFKDETHDMGDPKGAAEHVLSTLKQEVIWMIVEPFANDRPERITTLWGESSTRRRR